MCDAACTTLTSSILTPGRATERSTCLTCMSVSVPTNSFEQSQTRTFTHTSHECVCACVWVCACGCDMINIKYRHQLTHGSNLSFTAPGKTAFLIWPVGSNSELYSFCFNSTQATVYCFSLFSSLSLVKTPLLIVIKFALVSCFFSCSLFFPSVWCDWLFLILHRVIPHCHSFAPRHRPLPQAPVQRQVTRRRGSPVIGGASILSLPWTCCCHGNCARLPGGHGFLRGASEPKDDPYFLLDQAADQTTFILDQAADLTSSTCRLFKSRFLKRHYIKSIRRTRSALTWSDSTK